ncbi:MAG TPA: HDIG domain-containing protein [Polyangia bacterium]|jgi:poly(A) polymerase|nr:HDIG domain-containing protein [Polyangia bacterium]
MSSVSSSALFGASPVALLEVAVTVAAEGTLPPDTLTAAAREAAPLVATVSTDKLRAGIEAVIMGRSLDLGLQWMQEAGVLGVLLPELSATVDFSQEAGRRHKDVWEHTKQVVRQSVPHPLVRWAALLHDIGKVPTRVMLPDGRVTFHRHAEVGARMWDAVSRRLGFDKPERHKIRFLILHHLRANAYESGWTDAAVRRFDHEMGEHLDDLLDLSRADVTSRRPGRRQEAVANIHALKERILAIRELDARVPPLPPGLGNAIMDSFGIPPSRRIGDLRKLCQDAVERGELEERRDAPYYLDYLRKQGVV